jgi:exonuclease SbcC
VIRKIILENFMSHRRTVIEPAAGLTVIIGPNNCGKSAIAHALEMLCYNSEAASYAIRHGTQKATVTVETQDEDGKLHTLVWWRKEKTAGYIIDGREISGMGMGKIPDDLHQYLRMPEVPAATGEAFQIHFGLQKSPIFLLDGRAKEIRAAQFFASSSDADRLMDMQRRHKTKEAAAKQEKNRLDGEIAKLDQELSDLSPLDGIARRMNQLEADHADILDRQSRFVALSKSIDAIERAIATERSHFERSKALRGLAPLPTVHQLQPLIDLVGALEQTHRRASINRARQQVFADFKTTPVISETTGLARLVRELESGQRRLDQASEQLRITRPLQALPKLGDAATLSRCVRQLEQLTDESARQQERARLLSSVGQPPKVADVAAMGRHIEAIVTAQRKLAKLKAQHQALANIPPVPARLEPAPINDQIRQMDLAIESNRKARTALQLAKKNLADLATQIQSWVEQNPRCESCGQAITADLVMAGGHAHA